MLKQQHFNQSQQKNTLILSKTQLALAIMSLGVSSAILANQPTVELETIEVNAETLSSQTLQVDAKTIKQSATNLGDVLASQAGIQANQFGAGASAPVIRGQESYRLKILQNGADVVDMSQTSPDHAVVVDSVLAKNIEVVSGADVLRYGSGITGAVVNVQDDKILTEMPSQPISGEVGFRFNTGNDEKLTHAGLSMALGSNVALRVQGVNREANNYRVASYLHEHEGEMETSKVVENTQVKSASGSVGLSWVGDKGFVGVAYTERQDKYGLPGHSDAFHHCRPSAMNLAKLDCEAEEEHHHEDEHEHEEHAHSDPIVDLKSKRYDVQAQWNKPIAGVEQVRLTADYTDYKHDEVEDEPVSFFRNKGHNVRLEVQHQPVGNVTGNVGVQYGQNTMSITGEESLMNEATTRRVAVFASEKLNWKSLEWQLAGRVERHEIDTTDREMQDYKKTAYSYGTGLSWQMTPSFKWLVSATHQQRIPTALELYAKGLHLASNTWEYGNDQYHLALNGQIQSRLDLEKSNNFELGFHYKTDVNDFKLTGFYKDYDGYLYGKTLDRHENLRLIRYTQADAKFYGVDFDMQTQVSPRYTVGVFGDYVRGKIDGENAPRVPANRLGYRVKADFGQGWTGSVEAIRVYDQAHYADFESKTQGHNIMNVGVNYQTKLANKVESDVFFRANNLFDRPIYSHASFLSNIPQMGRNFNVGVNFKF